MPDTSKVSFNIINLSFSIASILKGISCVEGITLRGPVADPDKIMTTWEQFNKLYGGFISNSDFPLLCRRGFDRGAQFRVNSIRHYTDPSDKSTLTAIKASQVPLSILTFSAALVTGNVYNLNINAGAIGPVNFITDSDTTLTAIVTAIKTNVYVQDAYVLNVTGGTSNDRVIVIFPKTIALTLTGSLVTGGASQATTTTTTSSSITTNDTTALFNAAPKYHGADYNNLSTVIANSSNGNANYFNLNIIHSKEPSLNETYQNLLIPGNPNQTDSHYLDSLMKSSELMDFGYQDLSTTTGQLRPKNGTYNFYSGSDGSTPQITDYAGDSAGKTGLYAFDSVDDSMQICAPEISDVILHEAGAAYAESRQDLMYLAHLSNDLKTASALTTERDSTNIDSIYTAFYAGGIKITDPITGLPKEISELGDILGVISYSDNIAGQWYSYAGSNRGVITNVLGVINNFGTTASKKDLNLICNHQINMVISRNNKIYINGNFTGSLALSQLSYINAVRLLIFIQKSLSPTLERYIEEPTDIPTFKSIFRDIKPFFEALVRDRALYDWDWQGDQFITKITDAVINKVSDLQQGKYKVRLFIQIIPSLQAIGVDIIVAPTGISFALVQ